MTTYMRFIVNFKSWSKFFFSWTTKRKQNWNNWRV